MFIANNLSFERSSKKIFHDINISLPPKKIIHIIGQNGIGKTTLVKVLSNILSPTSGEIYWNSKNIHKNSGFFFKNLTFIMDINTSKKNMTVNENILFWKKIFLSKKNNEEIENLLKLLQINQYKNVLLKYMSYGEIRKLELCRLVIEDKKLWILDEPYLGLDKTMIQILNETFNNHRNKGGMIIFTSHMQPEISNLNEINLNNNLNNHAHI